MKLRGERERGLQRGGHRIRSGSGERRNLRFHTSKEVSFRGSSPSPAALPSLSFSPSPVFDFTKLVQLIQRIAHEAV